MRIELAALFCFLAFTATADIRDQAQECARLDDSLHRLTCFDRLFPKTVEDEAEESRDPTNPALQWAIDEGRSSIDDSPRVTAGLIAKEVSSTGLGKGEAFLLMRCSENTTSIILSTDMFLINESVSVTARLGQEPASTSRWERATNYKAVGLWSGAKSIPFIRRLTEHDKLVVRIQDRDRLDAEFDLGDVKGAAQKIASACNWKLQS
jgi:type VI secretion system protein VasI